MTFLPSPAAKEAMRRLTEAGFLCVYIGGCVRDACMGLAPHDFDLAASAFPAELLSVFAGCRTVTTGIRHGTVTVIFDNEAVEITSFRTDGPSADGRRPDSVRFCRSLEEDLRRRDFTVNALCIDAEGNLIDLWGGQSDLQACLIRAIGDADARFSEDELRVLRALRFAARLGFSLEEKTAAAVRRHCSRLGALSAERVRSEIFSLLEGADAARVLAEFPEIFFAVLPEAETIDFAARLSLLSRLPQDAPLRLAALLPAEPAVFSAALGRLALSNRLKRRISGILRRRKTPLPRSESDRLRLLGAAGETVCADLAALRLAEAPSDPDALALTDCIRRRPCCTVGQLAVTGGDLLAAGVPFGPAVGEALQALLSLVIEGKAENERAALLAAAKSLPEIAAQR